MFHLYNTRSLDQSFLGPNSSLGHLAWITAVMSTSQGDRLLEGFGPYAYQPASTQMTTPVSQSTTYVPTSHLYGETHVSGGTNYSGQQLRTDQFLQ